MSLRLLPLVLLAAGCGKLMAREAPPAPAEPAPAKAPAAPTAPLATPGTPGDEHARTPAESERFGLPFAWETSPEEPLAKARSFIAEVLRTNSAYATGNSRRLAAFPDAEKPRATVVSCADSRVQADAWDSTPENDNFTVRNLGNQVTNSLGAIDYGVAQLHTPVLLVIGHTGCGAIKAALEKPKGLSTAIEAELAPMKLPAPAPGSRPALAWKDAVVTNVHAQVSTAVKHFSRFVHSGELTVVGAVYDVRNDLGGGHGKLHVVDVNMNVEPARIDAFLKAVQAAPEVGPNATPAAVAEKRIRAIIERTEQALPPVTHRH